jgi:3-phosphoshikimate 1-carboxyvinyltransferase
LEFHLHPGGTLCGEVRVPGDKSVSHRAIMLGSLADGTTRIRGFLEGEDALATLAAFRSMGVPIERHGDGEVTIEGVGVDGLSAPAGPMDLGNSGTSIRLMSGLLAGQSFDSELTGDASLRGRPMGRVITPLKQMGADICGSDGDRPPLQIRGGRSLAGIHYDLPMASAQVKSCVLLAGLYASGRTSVTEPAVTRDHTERMLRGFGYAVQRDAAGVIGLEGGGRLTATGIDVPADISSAAFFMVAASIAPGSDLVLSHVGINPTRIGVINLLKMMGADISLQDEAEVGGEPVADVHVRPARLRAIEIPADQIPLAIDEFPALFIAAACAEGRTVLRGAAELRVKESDRIAAMAEGLTTLGVDVNVLDDGIVIDGFGEHGSFAGGTIDSHHDHRIAMSFAIAALRARDAIVIRDADNVATSFPGFDAQARGLGLQISVKNPAQDD